MELTRIIHPVGQGGFYSEKIKDSKNEINVIYDCGGNSQKTIGNYIHDYFFPSFPKQRIDALFISHLHDDHINGLMSLLQSYRVKYLILPQLTKDQLFEMYLYNYIHNHTDSNSLILELYDNIQNNNKYYLESRIIMVEQSNGDEIVEEGINDQTDFDILKDQIPNMIKSGTKIHFEKNWLFIPFNPPANTKSSKGFYDFFKDKMGIVDPDFDNSPFEKLPFIIQKKGKEFCANVYTQYFGNKHNAYSMALFSGTKHSNCYYDNDCDDILIGCPYHRRLYHKFYRNHFISHNCLFLGDFEVTNSFKALQLFYKSFWETIGMIQVPHHGSRNNYNALLYKYPKRGIISVGEHNRYHHPNIDTMIGLKEMDCVPIIVTESLSTFRIIHSRF